MTVFIDGAKRQGRLMGMTPEMVELMGLTMNAGGVRGRVNLESGKREREHHMILKVFFIIIGMEKKVFNSLTHLLN
jgi:phage tail tube protein FII